MTQHGLQRTTISRIFLGTILVVQLLHPTPALPVPLDEPTPVLNKDVEGPYATHVLLGMEEKWAEITTFHTCIVQTHRDKENNQIARYVGEMWLFRPNKVRINYRRTMEGTAEDIIGATEYTHVIWMKDSDWVYDYNVEEKTVSRDDMKGITSIPFIQAVVGVEAFKEKEFRKKHWVKDPVPVGEFEKGPVYLLRTKPEAKYSDVYQPFDVWLGKEDRIPRLITLYLPEETITIRLEGFEVNPKIDEKLFSIELPEGVVPIDRG